MNTTQRQHQYGFGHVGLIVIIVVIGLVGFSGWYVFTKNKTKDTTTNNNQNTQPAPQPAAASGEGITWENTSEKSWMAMGGTPPACPDPFTIASPTAQLSKATSILPPGQERTGTFEGMGGNYKPHGGFRFDNSKPTDVEVTAPIDGYVYRGSRFLMNGEVQYTFDLVHPCGYMVRLGHLRDLSPTYMAYAEKFPPAAELDSRTERITGFPKVKVGDVIATEVGVRDGPNVFFDLGVFDLRKPNEASKDPAYQAKHSESREHFYYGVCWYDMLPKKDSTFIKTLPAGDPISGKKSDYCK